ncbi:DUF423 domain-containing protein [Dyella flava]|uniref:DUF423 domain-containing protein n=1 Tax=Dyella flava TaxID=1920170 RepID=A0ABS2K8J8_9GAMM|nr:DUF423 domain-containing protein [Dyella flava]MBM7127264.1 DUF423 domain-containing protein [Dyella flava]GLQ52153.1 membrane protein [Dyella flava]
MRQLAPGRRLLVGLAGASAVLLGTLGAHALRNVLDAAHHELWHTAVEYHFWHALALVAAVACGQGKASRVAVWAFVVGIVLFSGSLYGLALGAPRWLGLVTPFGGVAFISGWIALGLSLRTRYQA